MKFLALMLCAVVAAAPEVKNGPSELGSSQNATPGTEDLVRQLFFYLRFVISNGSFITGLPPLDPLALDHYRLVIPTGLLNLDLELKNIRMVGISGFEVHRSDLNLRDMTFDLDISVPTIDIRAENYKLDGDFFTAIPLYGNGEARFFVENFRFRVRLFLKQSADGQSILIDRLENISFNIPTLKSELTGAIGGGDIDAIVNAMIEDVIRDYINRFNGAIGQVAGSQLVPVVNPMLDKLFTWRYIQPLIPKH